MARGNKNRGRGGFRGGSDDNAGFRGGRGRGNFRGGRGGGRGRGRGGPVYFDEFDSPIQQWPSNQPPATPPPRGYGPPRGRGRGRGFFPAPFNVYTSPRRGIDSPRGRGQSNDKVIDPYSTTRGRGRNLGAKLNAGAPLSKLLYEDRPYLKPVKFVRSVHTATLFENEEDIFQSVVETVVGDEESHIPTADAVFRVFHPLDKQVEGAEVEDGDDERLEEIDFADIARIQAEVDAAAARQDAVVSEVTTAKEENASFFVDTTPAEVDRSRSNAPIQVNRMEGALGDTNVDEDEDEEIIVYVAPHPRNGKSHTLPQATITASQILSTSILTGRRDDFVGNQPMAVDDSFQSKVSGRQPAFKLEMGTLFPESPHSAPEPDQLPPPPSFQQMANNEVPTIELAASPPVETSIPVEPFVVGYPVVENSAAPAAQPPATPIAAPTIDSVSFSFAQTSVKKQTRRLHPVGTPRALLKRNRKARRKSLRGFGAFGAMHEEAMLREVDPRRHEQRRGDSDVDWGTSDEEDGVDALSADMGGMVLDEGISFDAMKSFVKSMSAEGSRHVTMDDIADIERHRQEDEEADIRGSDSEDEDESEGGTEGGRAAANNATKKHSGDDDHEEESEEDAEVEAIVRAEEGLLVGDADGDADGLDEDNDEDDSEGSDSEDQDETPRRGFQARLERLRNQSSKGKGKAQAVDDSSDEAMSVQMTWADEDEDYLEHIQAVLDANEGLLGTGSRRARKYMTKAILNGDFDGDEYSEMMQPAKRGTDKYVAPELSDQWEKDRQKKAENKKKRALERMILAADPLAQHKGGKKGHKAMLTAVRAADDLPNRIVDLATLEQQIRRFMADIGGTNTMVLPPADKETRKRVHELATAFNLKSQSEGKGDSRYTTLIKTSKSGIKINEGKIRHIMRQATNGQWEGPSRGGGRGGKDNLAKHREGEEVGKDAAKIDEKNVGFRMLAAMGWTDGERIGLSGGLDAPLTAIMKKTKAGLGATPAMFS